MQGRRQVRLDWLLLLADLRTGSANWILSLGNKCGRILHSGYIEGVGNAPKLAAAGAEHRHKKEPLPVKEAAL